MGTQRREEIKKTCFGRLGLNNNHNWTMWSFPDKIINDIQEKYQTIFPKLFIIIYIENI